MKKIFLFASLMAISTAAASAQDIIRGISLTTYLVPKSARQPNLKLKDGSGIILVYKEDEGIHVLMSKNGKQYDLCDPLANATMVQVGETDIEKDGKPEIVVASKTSKETIEVKVYKKAEFETLYKEWSNFTGVSAVEFPGNGTVKMYDSEGNAGIYKFGEGGKIAESR